ncbi:MAG: transposase [Acidobacteriia bacterium]|nr:transposase [Terriglobia bacterium]
MARPLRINVAGGWYHVTGRGNERHAIFRDDQDRQEFLERLAEAMDRFVCVLYAYVLMDNHYHLELETRRANLSRVMQWLQSGYSSRFNRRHRRSGHLFQARFGAVVLEPAEAALEVSRYLHLNPIRVQRWGLGKSAERLRKRGFAVAARGQEIQARIEELRAYRWSSYRAYVGRETAPAWLQCRSFLKRVGLDPRAYQQYVEQALRDGHPESPWERLQGQVLLGTQAFVEHMREGLRGDRREQPGVRMLEGGASWEQIVAAVEEVKQESWSQFRDRHGDWGRDLALWLAWKQGRWSLRELGERVGGIDYTSVSTALKRFQDRCQHDRKLAALQRRARAQLPIAKT